MMMQQAGDIKFVNPVLPSSREVLLELQVNRLIKDFLFSAGKDENFCPIDNNSDVHKEANCKAGESCMIQTLEPSNVTHPSCLHVPEGRGMDLENGHFSNGDSEATQTATTHYGNRDSSSSNGSSLNLNAQGKNCMQEDKAEDTIFQLSRLQTFPQSRTDVLSTNSGTNEVDFEVKPSFRKPPLPPRASKLSIESDPTLSRCISDTGLLLKGTRRVKTDKRRRVSVAQSTNTSIWALVFTIFFAVLMIAQGFWSQGSQVVAFEETSGPHPVESAMKTSLLAAPQESNVSKLETKEGEAETREDLIADEFHVSKLLKSHARRLMDFKEFDPKLNSIKGS